MHFQTRLYHALGLARRELLARRTPDGHWTGELSSSALSTATAIAALAVVGRESAPGSRLPAPVSRLHLGLEWLARHVNADGGWGDTTLSLSNISTTTLCWAAFALAPGEDEKYCNVVQGASRWLTEHAGGTEPEQLAPAIIDRYGKDRTFSAPILSTCALSGRLGDGAAAWKWVLPLPFELAALSHRFFAAARLPVVSYALPALIAIGQARHHHLPSQNPFARFARNLIRKRTLDVLAGIQPASGGFLEAVPLTSFVVMSLASSGQADHPVTKKGVEFLLAAARDDGSWPIDTNLATWVTTLAVNALAAGSSGAWPAVSGAPAQTTLAPGLTSADCESLTRWLLAQQFHQEHPYTHAAPGGWAWTDLPGGVPDADDTGGALLALRNLSAGGAGGTPAARSSDEVVRAAIAGVTWLLELQNNDGGIPTFCRGWTNLPFDRSAADLTAHAIRAWLAWLDELPDSLRAPTLEATRRALVFLARAHRRDRPWVPLWFGNQLCRDDENAVYGTARVLCALARGLNRPETRGMVDPGLCRSSINWLVKAQHADGGWGGAAGIEPSVEETALAVESLACVVQSPLNPAFTRPARAAAIKGVTWLVAQVENGSWRNPSPIGFYFARLWYYERLYPQIFTVAALSRGVHLFPS